jgi:PleD family two-component response regulator
LGISIGMSELKSRETVRQWMERTDDILYHAKADGRSRVADK